MFWDFTYEPEAVVTDVITYQTTTNQMSGTTTTVEIRTQDVQVVTNWGDIARFGVTLLLAYSICLVATKVVTFWKRG